MRKKKNKKVTNEAQFVLSYAHRKADIAYFLRVLIETPQVQIPDIHCQSFRLRKLLVG